MSEQVRVDDLEVFAAFRVALLKFAQAVDQSLSNADSQIARTHSWLENEQASFWQTQLRKRQEAVTRARDAVRQKKLYKDAGGRTPGAVEEEKILARCIAAVQEAEEKMAAVRRWLPRLEKAADQYRGGVSRLGTLMSSDIPRAVALLDRLGTSLDQYMQIEVPATELEVAPEVALGGTSMSRGESAPVTAPPPPPPAAPITATSTETSGKEERHVTHGQ